MKKCFFLFCPTNDLLTRTKTRVELITTRVGCVTNLFPPWWMIQWLVIVLPGKIINFICWIIVHGEMVVWKQYLLRNINGNFESCTDFILEQVSRSRSMSQEKRYTGLHTEHSYQWDHWEAFWFWMWFLYVRFYKFLCTDCIRSATIFLFL